MEDKAGIGTNRLIKKGAILVTSAEEVLKYLGCKKITKNEEKVSKRKVPKEYENIYKVLEKDTLIADEISRKTNISIVKVNTTLTMLELEGYIENIPGNLFKTKE